MNHLRISRRRLASASLMAAAAIAMPRLQAQAKLEKNRVTIAVDGKASFHSLPLTIAGQLGYFQAEGLEVDIVDHPGPGVPGGAGGAQQAGAAVAPDVVSSAYEHTIRLQSRNRFFQAFVLHGRAPQIAMGVSVRSLPYYRTIADLRGKRIGVSAPGSSTAMVANLVLARGGLRPADVQFVPVGSSMAALAALRSGQVDAMSNVEPVITMLEQKGDVRIVGDTRTLKGTVDVFGGPMPAGCLQAPIEFVQRHPGTCQALTNAIVHALKWLQTAGPSDIIKTVPEPYLLGDRALYLASFNKVREAIALDGILPEEGAQTALKALARVEPALRPARIDLDRTYTNEFARRAKDRFKA